VSVVTVVRNAVTTLQRAADSVRSQRYPTFEHIVVDGASTDGTVPLLESLDDRFSVWISEADDGISDAFNKGIALARGSVIGLLNGDDWYEPDAIGNALAALERSGADIAYGSMQYWHGSVRSFLVHGDDRALNREMTIGHPAVFVRRDCYERFGLFRLDFRLAMDYEWLLRAKVGGARFVKVEHCLANMQVGGIGDRNWHRSQREVARARALHLGHGRLRERASYGWAITRGLVRRGLDGAGLGLVRRLYHRIGSSVRVEPPPR
jgi:glycosyltransferase involved in cell wall biosynthesis